MKSRIYIIVSLITCALSMMAQGRSFTYPTLPDSLKTVEKRMEYLALHYWDNFDFADTLLLNDANVAEQGFVNYIDLLPRLDRDLAKRSMKGFASKAFHTGNGVSSETSGKTLSKIESSSKTVYSSKAKFESLIEHYLDDARSPMRNDLTYLLFLEEMKHSPAFDETEKERIDYKIKVHNKNLPGTTALDFTFIGKDGKKHRLSDYKNEKVILYFYDPDCENCHRISAWLSRQTIPQEYTVLTIHADDAISELYSLQAMPTIYLLDKGNIVVLKDCSAETLIQQL